MSFTYWNYGEAMYDADLERQGYKRVRVCSRCESDDIHVGKETSYILGVIPVTKRFVYCRACQQRIDFYSHKIIEKTNTVTITQGESK